MLIGQVAAAAAVNVQTLRYYERVGLLPRPARRASGYRTYTRETVRRVRFIKRAQELGFTLGEVADLLALRRQSVSACERAQTSAAATQNRIAEKIRDLERMRAGLATYVTACSRRRPLAACPLLSALDHADDEAE